MKKSAESLDLLKPGHLTPGIGACFTLKTTIPESESIVRANRHEVFDRLGLEPEGVAFGNQVHSNRVRIVTQGGTYTGTDGLITAIPGLALAIQVADCAAVLMWDPSVRVVAAVHAGWRGAAGDIIPAAIEQMKELDADPQNIKAFVSPCISLAHFEVGEEVAVQFPDDFVDYESYSKPHVDLKGFIRYQLEQRGLSSGHIECHKGCTIEDADKFYSYRREGNKAGRMLGIIWIC